MKPTGRRLSNRRRRPRMETLESRRLLDASPFLQDQYEPTWDQQYSRKEDFLVTDDGAYFIADDPRFGREIWISPNDNVPARMIKDLSPGPANSRIEHLTTVGDTLFFYAYVNIDNEFLWTIWRSDGTTEGTYQLVSTGDGINGGFEVFGESVVFAAYSPGPDRRPAIWISDGTPDGTSMLWASDSSILLKNDSSSYVRTIGNEIHFLSYDGQYVISNGTGDSTRQNYVDHLEPEPRILLDVYDLQHGRLQFFDLENELRDGLFVDVANENSGKLNFGSDFGITPFQHPIKIGGEVFFVVQHEESDELAFWRSGGSVETTSLIPMPGVMVDERIHAIGQKLVVKLVVGGSHEHRMALFDTSSGSWQLSDKVPPRTSVYLADDDLPGQVILWTFSDDSSVAFSSLKLPSLSRVPIASSEVEQIRSMTLVGDRFYFVHQEQRSDSDVAKNTTIYELGQDGVTRERLSLILDFDDRLRIQAAEGADEFAIWVQGDEFAQLYRGKANSLETPRLVASSSGVFAAGGDDLSVFGDRSRDLERIDTDSFLIREAGRIWISDGTEMGTRMLFPSRSAGAASGLNDVEILENHYLGEKRVFVTTTIRDSNGNKRVNVWKVDWDGTARAVYRSGSGWANVSEVVGVVNDQLIFVTEPLNGSGYTLWTTTDVASGIQALLTDKPEIVDAYDLDLLRTEGITYFYVSRLSPQEQAEAAEQCELSGDSNQCRWDDTESIWSTDGTVEGTHPLDPGAHIAKVYEYLRLRRGFRSLIDSVGDTVFIRDHSSSTPLKRWSSDQSFPSAVTYPDGVSFPTVRSTGIYYKDEQHPDYPGVWRIDIQDSSRAPVPGLTGAGLEHRQFGIASLADPGLLRYAMLGHAETRYVTDGQTTITMPRFQSPNRVAALDGWYLIDQRRLNETSFVVPENVTESALSLGVVEGRVLLTLELETLFDTNVAEVNLDFLSFDGDIEVDLESLSTGPTKRFVLSVPADSTLRLSGELDHVRYSVVDDGVLIQSAGAELYVIHSDSLVIVQQIDPDKMDVRGSTADDRIELKRDGDRRTISLQNSDRKLSIEIAETSPEQRMVSIDSSTGSDQVSVRDEFFDGIASVLPPLVQITQPVNGNDSSNYGLGARFQFQQISGTQLHVYDPDDPFIGFEFDNSNAPRTNPFDPLDANGDRRRSPLDALIVINELSAAPTAVDEVMKHFSDTNRDGRITPLDALLVINWLARNPPSEMNRSRSFGLLSVPPPATFSIDSQDGQRQIFESLLY